MNALVARPGLSFRRPNAAVPEYARRQHGQALAEFLTVAIAIVPLFLLIPMLSKYQDISNATQLASRYAAFDATARNDATGTWKPESELADEVRRRFFSNADAPIKTGDTAGNFAAHQHRYWRDPQDKPLIADLTNDVNLSYGPARASVHAGGFETASDGAPFARANELGLSARGIYTANVSVKVANLPSGISSLEPFDTLNLAMERSTSLVIDPWGARGPQDAEQRLLAAPGFFPAGKLATVSGKLGSTVTTIDWPGGVIGPKLGQLDFWRDMVPDDRLSN